MKPRDVLVGPFARALERRREWFNTRFAMARFELRRLDGDALLDFLRERADPIVDAAFAADPGADEQALDRVIDALFEAALELVGRDLVARAPLVTESWSALLPRAAHLLRREPTRVTRSISNAVYGLTDELSESATRDWMHTMTDLAPRFETVDPWLACGCVAAWRAGLAHYREGALDACRALGSDVVARLLGVDADTGAEALVEAMAADPWFDPARSAAGDRKPAVVALAGGFRGFGGPFQAPPVVERRGGGLFAVDGERCFRLHADVYGAVLRPTARSTEPESAGPWSLYRNGKVSFRDLSRSFPRAQEVHQLGLYRELPGRDPGGLPPRPAGRAERGHLLMSGRKELARVQEHWEAHWEPSLACWSRFTRLSSPRWCLTVADEKRESLSGSFAMIRLDDHAVVISLRQVLERGFEGYPIQVMAHEIGHHVYCPGDLTDHGRMLARMRVALPTKEHLAPLVANLYADLLINNRLHRDRRHDMSGIYKALGKESTDPMWTLYMRIYEVLWSLPRGTLTHQEALTPELEGDAMLGSRLVRAYARHWLGGAGRFAALCLPYLLQDEGSEVRQLLAPWLDTEHAGAGGEPAGLAEIEDEEAEGALHPSFDSELTGLSDVEEQAAGGAQRQTGPGGRKKVDRFRGIIEYGEILKGLGLDLSHQEVAIRYYRERALPNLIRFPTKEMPRATEPLPEGLKTWNFGSPLGQIDWLESVIRSPFVVPGVTTLERSYGDSPEAEPDKKPPDLYIGIDCSGSMPNPGYSLSYPTLAGTIVGLSALRAGARVKVVLSGEPGSSKSTDGFVRNEREMLAVLTDYLGTGYAFGIFRLEETFAEWSEKDPDTHVLLITDQDIFSMLDDRKSGRRGWDVASQTLERVRAGCTCVLHMPSGWKDKQVGRLREIGWTAPRIYDWQELVAFAEEFSRMTWEKKP